MKDILKDTVVIDAANDAVMAHHGWRSIVVNLEVRKVVIPLCYPEEKTPQWPGYDSRNCGDPMHSRIDVRPGGGDITRQNLAREICGLLFNFHRVVSVSIDSTIALLHYS